MSEPVSIVKVLIISSYHFLLLYMWQSRVEIEDYSVCNISRKTRLKLAVIYLVLTTIILNIGSFQAVCKLLIVFGNKYQLSVALAEAQSMNKSTCFVHMVTNSSGECEESVFAQ